MKVAAVQCDVVFANPEANVERIVDRMKEAAQQGAELVVFPECCLSGYAFDDGETALGIAIEQTDPVLRLLADQCAQSNVAITVGFLRREASRLHNSAALITGDGIQGIYDKVHLPHLGVDRFVDAGRNAYTTHSISTTALGNDADPSKDADSSNETDSSKETARIGMAICYDSSFPEPMRVLGLLEADIVALGTNWPIAAARTAKIVPPARSMENHYYFVAANRVGQENGFGFCGQSSICGPDGIVLAASSDDQETILYADCNLEMARTKRIERTIGAHVIDRMADRRVEFYGPIVDGSLVPNRD